MLTISRITRAVGLLPFISLAISSFCPRFDDMVRYCFDLMLTLNNSKKMEFFDV